MNPLMCIFTEVTTSQFWTDATWYDFNAYIYMYAKMILDY